MLRSLAAAALAAVAAADCWDENKCIFHQYKGGTNTILYSWDLRSLCNNGNGYTFVNGSTTYRFEICGSIDPKVPNLPPFVGNGTVQGQVVGSAQTNTYCNPEYNAYPNAGNFLQFFDPNPATTCFYGPTSGPAAIATPGGTPVGGCPFVGSVGTMNLPNYCCTGQCEVLASGAAAYNYRWIDPNDVKFGGIRWTAYGNAADSSDEFTCPIDPNTGYPRQRQIQVNMYCNKNGKRTDALVVNSFYDVLDCVYRISMTHFAACGVEGDPFEYNQDPGVNFGFVILGGVLTVVFYYLFGWLDEKGYLEPIKSRLPTFTIPFTSIVFNGKGGVYGGGGSAAYKSVSSAGAGGASATPMASSAYGST